VTQLQYRGWSITSAIALASTGWPALAGHDKREAAMVETYFDSLSSCAARASRRKRAAGMGFPFGVKTRSKRK
jgi:hypothetical protein